MKKFLLITYYFPPCGGAGVQRWLRLLKYLPENGWRPTVVTTQDGDYPVCDDSLLAHIPDSVKVIRTKTPSFGRIFSSMTGSKQSLPYGSLNVNKQDSLRKKLLYWIRLNLIIPDARVIWNHACKKAVMKELMSDKYKCIITTGPPHSTHLVGLQLKKQHHIKWLADFRDPWTKIFYLKLTSQNRLVKKLNQKLEAQVVAQADQNLVISKSISDSLPKGMKKVFWNGFDPVDFEGIPYQKNYVFRIKYIGKLTEGQNIHSFLKVLLRWLIADPQIHIELSFIGTFEELPPEITSYQFNLRNLPFQKHEDALKETVNAELLILLINEYEGNEGMLTTKLFEYIGSRTPLLCIGPPQGEAASIISKFKAGTVCDYADDRAILDTLQSNFQKWKNGDDLKNTEDISEISAPVQAQRLAAILDSL